VIGGAVMAAVRAIGFFLRPIFGGESWGAYAITWSFIELASFFLVGGFTDAVVMFSARMLHPKDTAARDEALANVATLIRVPFALALAGAVGVQFLAPWLYEHVWAEHPAIIVPLLQYLVWTLPLLVLLQIPVEATRPTLRFAPAIVLVQIAFPLGSFAFALLAYFVWEPSILAVVQGTLISLGICVPVSLLFFKRFAGQGTTWVNIVFCRFRMEPLHFAFPQSLNMALNQGLNRMDSLMLSFFGISTNLIGVYALASDLTQVIRMAKMAFSGVFSPIVARYRAMGNKDGIQEALVDVARKTSALGLLVMLFVLPIWPLIILGPGETLAVSGSFVLFLCVGPTMSIFFGLCGNTLLMTGHARLLLLNAMVSGALNLILNLVLIPPFGLTGAAIATAISGAAISTMQLVELARIEGIRPRLASYGRNLALFAVPGVATLIVSAMLPLERSDAGWKQALGQLSWSTPDGVRIWLALGAIVLFVALQVMAPGTRPFGRPRTKIARP
jgi:O-antigen/teichoic acid export membrane protein